MPEYLLSFIGVEIGDRKTTDLGGYEAWLEDVECERQGACQVALVLQEGCSRDAGGSGMLVTWEWYWVRHYERLYTRTGLGRGFAGYWCSIFPLH